MSRYYAGWGRIIDANYRVIYIVEQQGKINIDRR